MTQTGYYLADGTWVSIPRTPLDRAGLTVPCRVVRPDGREIDVLERVVPDE